MLEWEDTRDVEFDSTMAFGPGYDFGGLEMFREEANTSTGRFMVWPAQTGPCKDWCYYGGEMGWYEQGFKTAEDAKAEVEKIHLSYLNK